MTRKVIKYHKSHQMYLLASIKVEIERNNRIPIIIISTIAITALIRHHMNGC